MAWHRRGGGMRDDVNGTERACALASGAQLHDPGLSASPETRAGSGLVSSAGDGGRAEMQGQVCVTPTARVSRPRHSVN